MARVLLTSVLDGVVSPDHLELRSLQLLRRCAEVDRFGEHALVTDPRDADLILFVELRGPGLYQGEIRRHPLYRAHRERCFVFCDIDYVVPFVPGLYASLPAHRYRPWRHRGSHYLRGLFRDTPGFVPLADAPRWLYSFRGAFRTHRVRPRLARLAGPRAAVVDTNGRVARERLAEGFMGYAGDDVAAFYALAVDSAFVLAPRGFGTSSMRLFEAMELGRAPVIIGDAWVPPVGPDWEDFSVRVAERDIARIPSLLAALEPDAARRGRAARAAWEAWFSEAVSFHRVVSWCLAIAAERRWSEPLDRWRAYSRLLDRDVLEARGRHLAQRARGLADRLGVRS